MPVCFVPVLLVGIRHDLTVEPNSLQAPVWRELYSEKMVVAEERRLRVDDSPMGKYQVRTAVNVRSEELHDLQSLGQCFSLPHVCVCLAHFAQPQPSCVNLSLQSSP